MFRHRRRLPRKPHAGTRFLLVLLFAATAAVTWQFARQQPVSRSTSSPKIADSADNVQNGESKPISYTNPFASRSGRPAYLYSVITGGIGSVEELRQITFERYLVVAKHFAGFDFEHADPVTIFEKQSMYVAYRMGDKVLHLNKMPLHTGETLISDGKIVARTRCGNRVAVAPLGPPAIVDPLSQISISRFSQSNHPRS